MEDQFNNYSHSQDENNKNISIKLLNSLDLSETFAKKYG